MSLITSTIALRSRGVADRFCLREPTRQGVHDAVFFDLSLHIASFLRFLGSGSWLRSYGLFFCTGICHASYCMACGRTCAVWSSIAYTSGPKPQRRTTSPCVLCSASIWVPRPVRIRDTASNCLVTGSAVCSWFQPPFMSRMSWDMPQKIAGLAGICIMI